jgi:hypothetical protein
MQAGNGYVRADGPTTMWALGYRGSEPHRPTRRRHGPQGLPRRQPPGAPALGVPEPGLWLQWNFGAGERSQQSEEHTPSPAPSVRGTGSADDHRPRRHVRRHHPERCDTDVDAEETQPNLFTSNP